jgi:hypothetical protein
VRRRHRVVSFEILELCFEALNLISMIAALQQIMASRNI